MRILTLESLVLLLGACGPAVNLTFTQRGGCGDVVMYARTASNNIEVIFQAPSLLAQAEQAGGSLKKTFKLEDKLATVVMYEGLHLNLSCDDVFEESERSATKVTGVKGTATLELKQVKFDSSNFNNYTGNATLKLENVEFQSAPSNGPCRRGRGRLARGVKLKGFQPATHAIKAAASMKFAARAPS